MEQKLIEKTIMEKYGSINNFFEATKSEGMSRTHTYKIIKYQVENPGVNTLEKIANILDIPFFTVVKNYMDYRKSLKK